MKKWRIIFTLLLVTSTSQASKPTVFEWDRPTQNTDGSCITDYGGYTLYFGRSSGEYDNKINLGDVNCTDMGVRNSNGCGNTYRCLVSRSIDDGDWYFVVISYDSEGIESDPSNEYQKTIGPKSCGFLCGCKRII